MMTRRDWISASEPLALTQQCLLAGVARSVVYAQHAPAVVDDEDSLLLEKIDAEYTRHPFYGSRRIRVYLRNQGYNINRKRVQRLMGILGLTGMAPGPATSRRHPEHPVYPYLLRGLEVTKPNQVWSTDITYIRLERGFVYLIAIIDWYSRKVLAWRVSNTLDSDFCVACLESALERYGPPEIFNTDQGCQFTSMAFTTVLLQHGIRISMDGRGRALDNIFVERLWRTLKYEDIYLKCYANVPELLAGLTAYFIFYNNERPHQALSYCVPDNVYLTGVNGGATVADKFSTKKALLGVETGQRCAAAQGSALS
jgi:putative transposase